MKNLNGIYKILSHRYGIDNLNKFLFFIYIIGFIISFFVKNFVLDLVLLLVFIVIIYRFLSKNIEGRTRENDLYLKIKSFIFGIFKFKKKNKRDKDYIYKRCSKCKKVLRLPLPAKRGIKHTRCPKCKKRLTVVAFRKLKVEYIRKGDNDD